MLLARGLSVKGLPRKRVPYLTSVISGSCMKRADVLLSTSFCLKVIFFSFIVLVKSPTFYGFPFSFREIVVASPVEDYFLYIDDLPPAAKVASS